MSVRILHKRALQKGNCIKKVNGGSHFWNPPFFLDCYFTAPYLFAEKMIKNSDVEERFLLEKYIEKTIDKLQKYVIIN